MAERMDERDLTMLVAASLAGGGGGDMGPAEIVTYYRQILTALRAPGAPVTEDSRGAYE